MMAKKINNKYDLEQLVYLRTDPEQYPRMVVCISLSLGNIISYSLTCGTEASDHFEEEIRDHQTFGIPSE